MVIPKFFDKKSKYIAVCLYTQKAGNQSFFRTKLLRHSAPTLNPPENVNQEIILRDITRKGKNYHAQDSQDHVEEHPFRSEINEDNYDIDLVLDIFKKHANSPWGFVENSRKFYFYKVDLPPDCDECDETLPLLPCPGECLVLHKDQNGRMELIRRGETIGQISH